MNNYPSLFGEPYTAPETPAKRHVATTSVTAYHSTDTRSLQTRVLDTIRLLGECSMRDVARKLRAEINTITPRFYELENQLHLIEYTQRTKKDPVTGRPANTYRCTTKADA